MVFMNLDQSSTLQSSFCESGKIFKCEFQGDKRNYSVPFGCWLLFCSFKQKNLSLHSMNHDFNDLS